MEQAAGGIATDGRVRRGDITRRAVLKRAVEAASLNGLDGLTIGQLAKELSISKSGLIAHFGTKEQLQLDTIRAARRIYADAVVIEALRTPAGLGQVWALSESWLDYSHRRVFPGGCFFAKASHDFGGRTGPVHDALAAVRREWLDLIAQTITDAREAGEIRADTVPVHLAFELDAYLESANIGSLLGEPEQAYALARRSVRGRLEQAAAPGVALPWAD
jgi:AcrR family transcriptional regulator